MTVTERILSEVAAYLPDDAISSLEALSVSEQISLREIRIKVGCLMLLCGGDGRRICKGTSYTKEQIETSFRRACGSSAYTHRHEIRSGFLTLPGGHRVGILGTAVVGESGRVEGMRDIYGLVFRIAREFPVETEDLCTRILGEGSPKNLLIAGPPCSGKTTFLRALAKGLSEKVQVAVVDEREELFPLSREVPVGCDVLRGYPKAVGILQALRTLSPRIIVCDEIGTGEEVLAMRDGLRSGASLLVSAHAYSSSEIMARPPIREMICAGDIDLVAFLNPQNMGVVASVLEREEFCVENDCASSDLSLMRGDRSYLRS